MLVYVCSPFRGDKLYNTFKAREYCRQVLARGATPIAPHLMYPQFLDDEIPRERDQAIRCNKEIINHCDAVWVFGDKITEGMQIEIDHAKGKGVSVMWGEEKPVGAPEP